MTEFETGTSSTVSIRRDDAERILAALSSGKSTLWCFTHQAAVVPMNGSDIPACPVQANEHAIDVRT